MAGERVLVVDDEAHIVELVKYNLESVGYKVYEAYDGKEALKMVEDKDVDIIILDLMLPGIDGLEVCRELKRNERTYNIPVIMLTAKGEEFDKILGLELGADDYITKPFSVRELMARIKVVLRRSSASTEADGIIRIGQLTIDVKKHEAKIAGKKLDLTLKEFELLTLFAANKGKVLSRDLLLDKIWGYEYCGDIRTVDVHIRHLRQKIEKDDRNPRYIETIRGIGYRFNNPME